MVALINAALLSTNVHHRKRIWISFNTTLSCQILLLNGGVTRFTIKWRKLNFVNWVLLIHPVQSCDVCNDDAHWKVPHFLCLCHKLWSLGKVFGSVCICACHSVCEHESSQSFQWIHIKVCTVGSCWKSIETSTDVFKANLMIYRLKIDKTSYKWETMMLQSVVCNVSIMLYMKVAGLAEHATTCRTAEGGVGSNCRMSPLSPVLYCHFSL